MPIRRTTVFDAVVEREGLADGPEQAERRATAVSASRTGTRAATTAPNAKSRTISVTGIESSSARCRSFVTTRSRASLAEMSPVSSIVTSGCGGPAARTEPERPRSSRSADDARDENGVAVPRDVDRRAAERRVCIRV